MTHLIPGTDAYWTETREAFALIRELRDALHDAETSGQYTCSGYDEDGEPVDVIENTGPWDRAAELMQDACQSERAVQVLRGLGFNTFRNGVILNRRARNANYRDLAGI